MTRDEMINQIRERALNAEMCALEFDGTLDGDVWEGIAIEMHALLTDVGVRVTRDELRREAIG